MHKPTTSKIFGRAKQLHRNMSPAEEKFWTHLRAHLMGEVHFINQHAIGNDIVDFSPEEDDVCSPQKTHH
jgi:very-short-patch-repair endonuclease